MTHPPSQLVPKPFNWSPNTFFNRYFSNGRSNKKIKILSGSIFKFCFWEDPPPTQSTGPQTLFFTDISVSVAQIKKNKSTYFWIALLGGRRTLPTQSTGPQPIQMVLKHFFYRYLGIGRSNQKIEKKGAFFMLHFQLIYHQSYKMSQLWRTHPCKKN